MSDTQKTAIQVAQEQSKALREQSRVLVAQAAQESFPIGQPVTYSETIKHTTEVVGYDGSKIVLANGSTVPFQSLRLIHAPVQSAPESV